MNMDLDDFRNQSRSVKAPPINPAQIQKGIDAMSDLVEQVKAQDQKEAHQLRKARPLWLLAAVCFALVFLVLVLFPPAGTRMSKLWLFGVLTAVYLLNAVLMARKVRFLSQIDYTESVRTFLQKTERRLQFMLPEDYCLAGIGLLTLGVVSGLYISDVLIHRYFSPEWEAHVMVLYAAGYLALCVTGFLLTYRNWKNTKAPLLREIRRLQDDLSSSTKPSR
jgi:FtsH-binding integral membrane protein